MAEVICDEFSVKEILGPSIFSIDFEQLNTIRNEIKDDDTMQLWQNIKQKVGTISVSESEGLIAIKNYLALKKIIDNEQISGITLECYPHHMGELCLAFSLLANEGIASACEGDVNSLILAYILMKLSGSPFHNIDPLYFYEDNNTLLGSHCGCGSFNLTNLSNQIELANVRLANKGLCVLFPSKPGKVTMANLVGRKGTYRLSIIEAEALQTEMVFPGNPIKLKLSLSINAFLDKVEKFGIGHHWIIVYGNYIEELKILSSLLNIDLIEFP
jgi:L-fucose isomerase-like protein